MTTKTKLTVVTPFGTFTRTTARTYTHVVVCIGERAEHLKARSERNLKREIAQLAQYEIDQHGPEAQVMNYAGTEKLHDFASYIAGSKAMIEGEPARLTAELAANEKRIANKRGSAAAWCGRLDLAQKEAATLLAKCGMICQISPVVSETK